MCMITVGNCKTSSECWPGVEWFGQVFFGRFLIVEKPPPSVRQAVRIVQLDSNISVEEVLLVSR